jgi:hypothetical protein
VPHESPRLSVEPLAGPLPAIRWRWDAETDILAGSFRRSVEEGLDGTVELNDPAGAVAVLDIADGTLAGLDIVVWPDVETVPALAMPAGAVSARLVLAAPRRLRGASSYEMEAPLRMRADPSERLYHLRIGAAGVTRLVRIADHLLVELDADDAVAGCWLAAVPPFPSLDDAP